MSDYLATLNLDHPIADDDTYHLRNPLLPAQPLHAHKHVKLTDVEKNVQRVVQRHQKETSLALAQDLEDLRAETENKIKSLSLKYSKKESFVREHILNVSGFKTQRKPNLYNAEVSVRAKELRESKYP